MHYWLVMPAAGASLRFGGAQPKQHVALAGRSVLELALQLFVDDTRCAGIALVLTAAALGDAALLARLHGKVLPVVGGPQRCDSVSLGLEALVSRAASHDWVLVHDAARPCLSAADLERLLAAGAGHPDGALLAAPLTDTIKQSDASGQYQRTVDRAALWRALTPQMFRFGLLQRALRDALTQGRVPTDESQAVEWQGGHPLLIAGQDCNVKITTADDLAFAAAIFAGRGKEKS